MTHKHLASNFPPRGSDALQPTPIASAEMGPTSRDGQLQGSRPRH